MFEKGLTPLLEKLKQNGWSPTERAIVFLEWQKSLGSVWFNPNGVQASNPSACAIHQASRVICDELKKLNNPSDLFVFVRNVKDYSAYNVGDDIEFKQGLINVMMEEGYYWLVDQKVDRQELIEIVSGSLKFKCDTFKKKDSSLIYPVNQWQQYAQMNISEDEFDDMINRNTIANSLIVHSSPISLQEVHEQLKQQCALMDLDAIKLSPLDVDNQDICWTILQELKHMNNLWNELGLGVSMGLNRFSVVLGSGDLQSSGLACSGKHEDGQMYGVAVVNNKTGFGVTQVLMHEMFHLHDRLLERMESGDDYFYLTQQQHPAVIKLMSGLTDLQDTTTSLSLADCVTRWSGFVNNVQRLEDVIMNWKMAGDERTLKEIVDLFDEEVDFSETSGYRASLLLAELHLSEERNASTQTDFVNSSIDLDRHFQSIFHTYKDVLGLKNNENIYDAKEYLSSNIEVSARGFQALFAQDERRLLMIPNEEHHAKIKQLFTDFLHDPDIQQRYQKCHYVKPVPITSQSVAEKISQRQPVIQTDASTLAIKT